MSNNTFAQTSINRMIVDGFWSAVLLKPLAALIGIVYLIILVRNASAESYAVYVAAWAIIEIATLISNAGTLPAAYRYVNRAAGSEYSPAGPVAQILILRSVTLIVVVPVIYALLSGQSAPTFSALLAVFPVFALIIVVEGIARMTDVMLESCLSQKLVQMNQFLRIIFKILPAIYFAYDKNLEIQEIFYAELIGVSAGFLSSSFSLMYLYCKPSPPNIEKNSLKKIVKYAIPAYFTQFANVFYNIDTFKIVLGKYSDPMVVATFGFSHSISGIVQRYMPVNLLSGFIRPLFIINARVRDGLISLNNCNNLWTKLNFIVVSAAIIVFWYNGELIIRTIDESYLGSVAVITVFLISFLVSSLRLCLANFCLGIEYPRPPLLSEIACIPTLLLLVPISQTWGAIGAAFAVLITEFIWLAVCLINLRGLAGIGLSIDWLGIVKIAVLLISVCAFGLFSTAASSLYILASIFALMAFGIGIWLTSAIRLGERAAFLSIVSHRGLLQS